MNHSQLNICTVQGYHASGSQYSPQNSKENHSHVSNHDIHQLEKMQAHIQQLENQIQLKDQEIKDLKVLKEQFHDELDEIKAQLNLKNDKLQILKKRLLNYEEIDQFMAEKDEEIFKLTRKAAEQQLKARLKETQLVNQNKHLLLKLSEQESKDIEILVKYEKQKQIIEQLYKQKQQSQTSMKKIISNLKEKNKSFMDKINDLQKQLIEVSFEKEMKEKQLQQLKNSFANEKRPVNIFDNFQSPRSPFTGEDFGEGLDSVRGNYSKLGEQLSIDLDRADLEYEFGSTVKEQNSNKRFTELLQQNYLLKQQLHKIQCSSTLDSKQSKDLQDQIQKMKKIINILKRRNDEIQNQRKQEVNIMIGLIEECYSAAFSPLIRN